MDEAEEKQLGITVPKGARVLQVWVVLIDTSQEGYNNKSHKSVCCSGICLNALSSEQLLKIDVTPLKTNMTMEKQAFEDVSPIKN